MTSGKKTFKELQDEVQAALLSTTRSVNRLATEDLGFQRAINPSVADSLEEASSRLLQLSTKLLSSAADLSELKPPKLEDSDDVDLSWRGVVDVVDTLLEKADTALDEYTGLVKRKEAPAVLSGPVPKRPKQQNRPLDRNLRAANISKPQNSFAIKPNNFPTEPWKPLLTTKPHALKPLKKSLKLFSDESGIVQFEHPYQQEILQMKYPDATYEKSEPIPFQPAETTAAIWVDTYEGVLMMLEELKKADEIAVDLEHHDFRTYQGLLSLMQISTREQDWIVDTLKPWRLQLEVLNEVFADPTIIKVFHGAHSDIVWLQRDLGLYIVGLFDTYFACDALHYQYRSLAFLLQKFADFEADKKYQMADWRIRPLPEEMFYYARSDTHYLLYIYDKVRNELVEASDPSTPETNLLQWVLDKSKETSLLRYEDTTYDAESGQGPRGWLNALTKTNTALSNEQFAVYKAIHQWRDTLARKQDESPFFIMSQQAVSEISRIMPLDPKALHSVIHNASHLVKTSLDELFKLITDAKQKGTTGPSLMDFLRGDSLGAVANAVLPAKGGGSGNPQVVVVQTEDLRSRKSQLWGSMPMSSLWEETAGRDTADDMERITLPWGHMMKDLGEIITIDAEPEAPEVPSPSRAEPPKPEAEEVDEEFTLKAGRKRRRPTEDAQEDADADKISLAGDNASDDSEAETKRQRKEARRRRKLEKQLKKERKQAKALAKSKQVVGDKENEHGQEVEGEEEGEAAFDYANAQSVLHAKKDGAGAAEGKKSFDPYATKDGPKAARRMNHEKIGKSGIFKKK